MTFNPRADPIRLGSPLQQRAHDYIRQSSEFTLGELVANLAVHVAGRSFSESRDVPGGIELESVDRKVAPRVEDGLLDASVYTAGVELILESRGDCVGVGLSFVTFWLTAERLM